MPARTVAGPTDPRLGKIDVVLVSHMHGDHAGDRHTKAPNAGSCAMPDFSVAATPNSNSVEIAVAKKAKMVTGSEMAGFFAGKMKAAGGNPKDSLLVRFGASKKVGGVTFTTVPATHSNGVSPAFNRRRSRQAHAAGQYHRLCGPTDRLRRDLFRTASSSISRAIPG